MSSDVLDRARNPLRPASVTALVLWLLSLLILFVHTPNTAWLALSGGVFAVLLGALTMWLLPRSTSTETEEVLRASSIGVVRLLQITIIGATVAWTVIYGIAYGGRYSHVRIPLVSALLNPLLNVLSHVRPVQHLSGLNLHNSFTLALIPGILLLAPRMRPRELGLCVPVRGTLRATLVCLVVPLGFIIWAFASKGLTVTVLGFWLLHNLLSNGFSEEFFARG